MYRNSKEWIFIRHILLLSLMIAICFALSLSRVDADSSEYTLFGDASYESDGTFCLVPAEYWSKGGLCFNETIKLKDGMTATFEYRVSGGETSNLGYADGFVFVISPSFGLGSNGGSLAFPGGNGTYGIEFDSYINGEYNDPSDAHVGIIYNSVSNHLATKVTGLVTNNGWTKAKVEYKDKKLTLYINGTKYVSALANNLPDEVFIGFSSSTGAGYAKHEVRNIKVIGIEKGKQTIITTGKKCVVTFDAKGGTVKEKTRQYFSGELYGTLPIPKKEGYVFKGWYHSSGGKSVKITSNKRVSGNVTLRANWKLRSTKKYKVKFDPNGGKGGMKSLTKYKYVPLLLEGDTPTLKGYFFKGWAVSKKGKIKYRYREYYKSNKEITLYAKWKKIPSNTSTKTSNKGHAVQVSNIEVDNKIKYSNLETMFSQGRIKIPGLDSCCVAVGNKTDMCDVMVPQGICAGKGYIFVSAYCKDLLHNSVLHVIREEDGKYIGTVTLDHPKGKNKVDVWDHNGGIEYDGNDYIWVANSKTGKVSAVNIDKVIDSAIKGGKKKALLVKYVDTFNCKKTGNENDENIESASFLTYNDGTLWVGICKESKDENSFATLYGYKITYNNKGEPTKIKLERSWPIQQHANGAVFVNYNSFTYLIVSSQTGKKHDSSLVCYKAHDNGFSCVFEKKGKITLPPMLEELCVSNDRFFSIYESAAKPYKKEVKNNAYMNEICVGNTYDVINMLLTK